MPCRWFRLHASMKRLIGNRAAVFDVTLHYKHRDALAVAREHKRLIWFLKADLPAMNVQGKDHCLICNFISALDGNSSVVLTDNPSVVPEKLRTLDRGRPWRDSQFASTRLSPSRDMSR